MTANANKIKTVCECQLSSDEEDARTKDKFACVSSMHEIDEDSESDEETVQPSESLVTNPEKDVTIQDTANASEDESAYTGESFCSDESCDESEVVDETPGSLVNDPSFLPHTVRLRHSGNVKPADARAPATVNSPRLYLQNDELDSLCDEQPSAITMDRFAKPKNRRRWNMSFTDEEMRRIERENELLLRKIMAQQKPRQKILEERVIQSRTSSSAINRRKLQKKIDDDNMVHNFLQSEIKYDHELKGLEMICRETKRTIYTNIFLAATRQEDTTGKVVCFDKRVKNEF